MLTQTHRCLLPDFGDSGDRWLVRKSRNLGLSAENRPASGSCPPLVLSALSVFSIIYSSLLVLLGMLHMALSLLCYTSLIPGTGVKPSIQTWRLPSLLSKQKIPSKTGNRCAPLRAPCLFFTESTSRRPVPLARRSTLQRQQTAGQLLLQMQPYGKHQLIFPCKAPPPWA